MKNEPKRPKTPRAPWSVDPDADLKQLMKSAIKATGKTRSELIRECLKGELANTVKQILSERRKSEQQFVSEYGDVNKPSDKAE